MYEQREKGQNGESRAVAHSVTQRKRSGGQLGFVDNRTENFIQQKADTTRTHNLDIVTQRQNRVNGGSIKENLETPVVQRFVVLGMTQGGIIDCKGDGNRPPGNIKGSNGDHTTPFTILESQVVNAIIGTDLKTAWANLRETLKVYQGLPGFTTSKKQTQEGKADLGKYIYDVGVMLSSEGDEVALQNAANALLALRNQIDLSALPTKGGGGKGESKWAGALQDLERDFFLPSKKGTAAANAFTQRNAIIYNMTLAFDHGRIESLDSSKQDSIWEQHCITITDAYPQLSSAAKISAKDLMGLKKNASAEWHKLYD